jgi:uncharacterized tellurite resistance protein B-like protein
VRSTTGLVNSSAADLQTLHDLAVLAESELNAVSLADSQRELRCQLDVERRRALIDPLTRLWNRDGIMEVLTREHSRAMRYKEHLVSDRGYRLLQTHQRCVRAPRRRCRDPHRGQVSLGA